HRPRAKRRDPGMGPPQRAQCVDAWPHPGGRHRRIPRGDLSEPLTGARVPAARAPVVFNFAGGGTLAGPRGKPFGVFPRLPVTALRQRGYAAWITSNRNVRSPGGPTITVESRYAVPAP